MEGILIDEKYICRDFQPQDKELVLKLFLEVFGKEMSSEFWDWRFAKNPFGQPIIKLLFDNDLLIGHYAIIPCQIADRGESIEAMLSMTTMVKKEYQGQGIFSFLADQAYQEAQKQGIKIVFGFPNSNSYHGFVKNFGWIGMGPLEILEREVLEQSDVVGRVKDIDKIGEEFDSFWEEVKRDFGIIGTRNSQALNWRYIQNPINKYFFKIAQDDSGRILGYVVLKIYQDKEEKIGHIIDIVAKQEAIRDLIESSNKFFYKEGVRRMTCWAGPQYYQIMLENGFVSKPSTKETFFGAKSFDPEYKIDLNKWQFTMGDSDNF